MSWVFQKQPSPPRVFLHVTCGSCASAVAFGSMPRLERCRAAFSWAGEPWGEHGTPAQAPCGHGEVSNAVQRAELGGAVGQVDAVQSILLFLFLK